MATGDNGPGIEQKSQERNYDDIVNNQQAITDHLNCLDDHDVAMGARDRLFGCSKLHEAATNGHTDLLKSLLSRDSNSSEVNGRTIDGGSTPLHLAVSAGHADCVEELLKHPKTDIHVTDTYGRTPVEIAELSCKSDVAKLLRSHGKNMHIISVYACKHFDLKVIKQLQIGSQLYIQLLSWWWMDIFPLFGPLIISLRLGYLKAVSTSCWQTVSITL